MRMVRSRIRTAIPMAIAISLLVPMARTASADEARPPAPSSAAPANIDAQAKQHFQAGEKLTNEGQYLKAFDEFSAGYILSSRPLFLFNMAECARLSGDLAKARDHYNWYLAKDPNGKLAPKASERLAEIARILSTPAALAPAAPAPVVVAPVTPAPTTVPATAATTPAPKSVSGEAAPAPDLTLHSSPAEGQASAAPADLTVQSSKPEGTKPVWKRWQLWVGVAGGVVVAGVLAAVLATQIHPGSGADCSGSSCTQIDLRGY